MAAKRETKFDRVLRAAKYFGAEYAANPGSSRLEYMESIALKMGKKTWSELAFDDKRQFSRAFDEGVREEKALLGKGRYD